MRITFSLCRLTESKIMIRSHFTATVPGLIVSDVNFNFSCFVHNYVVVVFFFLGGVVFCKSGVPLFLGHRDTVSY